MVLRNEFKKMMRETRAEGVKLLRAEQEQRRQIESQLRSLRRERNGGHCDNHSAAANSTHPPLDHISTNHNLLEIEALITRIFVTGKRNRTPETSRPPTLPRLFSSYTSPTNLRPPLLPKSSFPS
ncbi:hypothetical protein KCU89_g16505, partial [Aureobasidium melanogenum]